MVHNLQAQFTIGAEAGYNIYHQQFYQQTVYLVTKYDLEEENTISGALCLRYQLTRRFSIEAKPGFSSAKSRVSLTLVYPPTPYYSGGTSTYADDFKFSYANLPVFAQFYITPSWFVGLGPQINVLRKGHDSTNDLNDACNKQVVDLALETGILESHGFELGISFRHSLQDITDPGYDPTATESFKKYTTWRIYLGMRLYKAPSRNQTDQNAKRSSITSGQKKSRS